MRWRKASAVLTATLALGGVYWAGCGDDDDDGAFFAGDVSSVVGGSAAVERERPSLFAYLGPALAHAQSSCAAPTGDLLFCVDFSCTRVGDDCEFARLVFVEGGGPLTVTLRFVDDANEDGTVDFDEDDSIVEEIAVCNGDQVLVADAAIDFSGTTSASIVKTVDNCPGANPLRTRTPVNASPTPTPTTGGALPTATPTTPGGATPTSTYGVAMNDTPLSSFAFFASVAVVGLLLPRRRRRNSEGT